MKTPGALIYNVPGKVKVAAFSAPPLTFFGIVNKVGISFHFRVSQSGVEGVCPGIPDGSVKRKSLYIREHSLDFPHHQDAVPPSESAADR